MSVNGKLITTGIGRKRLNDAFVSQPRIRQYITSDWDYEDVFVECLSLDKLKQIGIVNQQLIEKINQYIIFSKKHKRLPSINRIVDFFDKKIDKYIADKILKLIVDKKQKELEYDLPILINTIDDIKDVSVILVSKQLLIKLIRNKNIECKFGCMFFNNIRIVENKLNFYNIMVLTNENKLRVVMLKMKLF